MHAITARSLRRRWIKLGLVLHPSKPPASGMVTNNIEILSAIKGYWPRHHSRRSKPKTQNQTGSKS